MANYLSTDPNAGRPQNWVSGQPDSVTPGSQPSGSGTQYRYVPGTRTTGGYLEPVTSQTSTPTTTDPQQVRVPYDPRNPSGGPTTWQGGPPGVDGAPQYPPGTGPGMYTIGGQIYNADGTPYTGTQTSTPGGTSTGSTTYTGSPTDISGWLAWMAQQPGHDPILDTPGGIQYYTQAIQNSGGLSASNLDYWKNKAPLAQYGGLVGAGGGGGGGYGAGGFLWSHQPSLQDLQNSPGFQFALQNGANILQASAAAKGDVLSGGALKDLSDYTTNMTLNQLYLPSWQLQNQSTQNNAQNLYNMGVLDYNASSVGPSSPV